MIRKYLLFSLCCMMSVILIPDSVAQARKKSTKKDDHKFAEKVWVGGAINNNLQFGGGAFSFGLSPMAAYEIVPHVSIGPFVRLDYHYERLSFGRPYFTYRSFDVGPGVFSRVDVYRGAFAQVEYEHAFIQIPRTDFAGNILFDNDRRALKETEVQHYVYLGAGYASGTNVRYGVSIHYNVLDDFNYIRFPWDYRITIRVQL